MRRGLVGCSGAPADSACCPATSALLVLRSCMPSLRPVMSGSLVGAAWALWQRRSTRPAAARGGGWYSWRGTGSNRRVAVAHSSSSSSVKGQRAAPAGAPGPAGRPCWLHSATVERSLSWKRWNCGDSGEPSALSCRCDRSSGPAAAILPSRLAPILGRMPGLTGPRPLFGLLGLLTANRRRPTLFCPLPGDTSSCSRSPRRPLPRGVLLPCRRAPERGDATPNREALGVEPPAAPPSASSSLSESPRRRAASAGLGMVKLAGGIMSLRYSNCP
mmetsp:Transcript_27703/g.69616  ORF Transcript_27703/g.69616 Transcript_27703/m.69616 type:complete len:274 (-) Transcript_27703:270-1091(-)